MSKTIIAVNAGPRRGWNTDTLISEAAKGADCRASPEVEIGLFKTAEFDDCFVCHGMSFPRKASMAAPSAVAASATA